MQTIVASVKSEEEIPNGAEFSGDFKSIWVGVAGNIAISRNNGATYRVYKNVPGSAFFNVKGNFIATLANGTTASELLACTW